MSIVYRTVTQGTAEWYALRLGIPTSSAFHKIITPTGRPSTQARGYMHRLIAERLLNESMDDPVQAEWAEWGRANEPLAAAQFAFAHGDTEPIGFITNDAMTLGCSPDRLILGRNEGVEIKCPSPPVHLGYALDGPGNDYRPQVQGQLLVGELEVIHFYSWHPRMPPVHIVTHRDEKYLELMTDLLDAFLEELEAETERARQLGTYVPSAKIESPAGAQAPGPEPVQNVIDAG